MKLNVAATIEIDEGKLASIVTERASIKGSEPAIEGLIKAIMGGKIGIAAASALLKSKLILGMINKITAEYGITIQAAALE